MKACLRFMCDYDGLVGIVLTKEVERKEVLIH